METGGSLPPSVVGTLPFAAVETRALVTPVRLSFGGPGGALRTTMA
jgi:hypothetical protein